MTDDTVASGTVVLSDFTTNPTTAKLLNVCSYESASPTSNPEECVITPDSGFLTIVKVADPNDGTAFQFNASAASTNGDSSWTINGSGSVQLIPYLATNTLDLNEVVPAGWTLSSASCEIQSATPAPTGTSTSTGVNNLEIESGLETVCTFTDEVVKATPAIATNATNATAGGTIQDTATLSGGTSPTGTITFQLFSDAACQNQVGQDDVVTVSGNGDYTSAAVTVNAAGSYFWIASYSGDANNDPVSGSCGDAGETSVVSPATPAIATNATNATAGGTIQDTATLSGGTSPTGTITFQLFSDAACQNQVGQDDVVTVSGNGDYTSAAVTVNAAGSYFWIASYSGDANNDPVSGSCGDAGETSVVSPAKPAIATNATNATAGGTIQDTATLSGGTNPTGTITFQLFSDAACQNQVGQDDVVTVSGNGDYTSAAVTVNAAGSYFWIASYSGDDNNEAGQRLLRRHRRDLGRLPGQPAIATNATNATAGGTIQDTATLSGGTNPTGTITFQLFSDAACQNQVGQDDVVTVSGNGDYTSAAVTVNAAGSYFWIASYSGDDNNEAVSGSCGDTGETSVVSPAEPAIATNATNATAGGTIQDTATLSGGTNPTGTITFQLFSDAACENQVGEDDVVTVSGNGDYTSAAVTVNAAGSYFWIASYSGDDNNEAVSGSCGDTGETSVVSPATPAIATNATNATAGGTIQDTATLSGGTSPTGTITFQLFSDAACQNQVGQDDVVTVSGNGDYTSAAVTVNAAGSYFWIASYSGDDNNEPVSGSCGDTGETSVVSPATPAIATNATNATAGGTIQDTATLSGGTSPTGTITFQLFSDAACENQVGEDDVVTVSGNGDYTSAAVTVNAAGSYFWIASYSGDANNDPVSGSCGDAGETSVVSPATPAIATNATNATAGGTIQDTATLSGGTSPTGTITFQLFSDAACQNQVGQDDVVTVSGNGDYTSAAVTVNAAGSYFWIASYSGDANNDPVSGSCGDAGETSVVSPATPAIATNATNATAGGTIQDTATLSGGTSPTGTITFQLFSDAACQNQVGQDDVVTVSGNGDYTSAAVTVNAAGSYFWIASYSGDANNDPVSGSCGDAGETSVVSPATPAIATNATNATAGGTIQDTATLSGGTSPTGTITFQLFSDAACENQVGQDDVVTVSGNGDYTSAAVTVNAAGSYFWIASYSGDANNDPVSGSCGDAGETSVVSPADAGDRDQRHQRDRGRHDPGHRHALGRHQPDRDDHLPAVQRRRLPEPGRPGRRRHGQRQRRLHQRRRDRERRRQLLLDRLLLRRCQQRPGQRLLRRRRRDLGRLPGHAGDRDQRHQRDRGRHDPGHRHALGRHQPDRDDHLPAVQRRRLPEPGRPGRRRHGQRQRRLHQRRRDRERRRQLLLDRLLLRRCQQRPGQRLLRRRRRDLGRLPGQRRRSRPTPPTRPRAARSRTPPRSRAAPTRPGRSPSSCSATPPARTRSARTTSSRSTATATTPAPP